MANKITYSVYKLTEPTGKCYIGMTSRKPQERWDSGHGYKGQPFGKAIIAYGWSNIKKEILFQTEERAEAERMERFYISYFQSNNSSHGYNKENGGIYGKKLAKETKDKISKTLKEKCIVPPSRKGAISEKRKPLLQYDSLGNLIAEYPSQLEASIAMGVHVMSVSDAVNGKTKTCKGYILKRKAV